MIKDTFRVCQTLLFLLTLFVLAASLYFQYVKGLEPCPLCIMQRACVVLALVLCAVAALSRSVVLHKRLILFQLLLAFAGLYFSGRQLWLQTLPPDQLAACLPGMEVLLHYFPWRDILHALIFGAADCGEVTWRWLGFSMPAWSALYFTVFFASTFFTRYLLVPKSPET